MKPEIHILHTSDFYQIRNFKCNCTKCNTSATEYTERFCICFIRSGFFEHQVFRRNHEAHVGRILVAKPRIEHVTRHIDNQPDLCTVFDFTHAFYSHLTDNYKKELGWFFDNPDLHSVLIQTNPETEYVHGLLANKLFHLSDDHLLMDDLVVRLVSGICGVMSNKKEPANIPGNLIRHHLLTIEKARAFVLQHFESNISLQQLADHCCVSLFHFARIFKSVMNISPHQYLLQVRLHHAKVILQSTALPVADVAFRCGFNSLEYFTTAFRQRFRLTPTDFRQTENSIGKILQKSA